jgi:heme-degrading monooxygenase HmoA
MFARKLSIRLKSNMLSDYNRTFENDVLPLLREQKGFKDAITLSNAGSPDVIAISLWENKASAEAYTTSAYPVVLAKLRNMIDGTPELQTFDATISTLHKVAIAA